MLGACSVAKSETDRYADGRQVFSRNLRDNDSRGAPVVVEHRQRQHRREMCVTTHTEVAVHYGLGSPLRSLNDAGQILLRQAMVLRLRILTPVLFVPALLHFLVPALTDHYLNRLLFRSLRKSKAIFAKNLFRATSADAVRWSSS